MRRRELLAELRRIAKEAHVEMALVRHGGRHDVYRLGAVTVVVPRHTEINELTARGILLDAGERLGREQP
jgi:mRNA interferase HicA